MATRHSILQAKLYTLSWIPQTEPPLIESSGLRLRNRLFDNVTVLSNDTYSVMQAYPGRRAAKLKTIHRHLFR